MMNPESNVSDLNLGPVKIQETLGINHLPPVSMDDRPIATQQKTAFSMAHINSRRGSQSPVDVAREETGITELPNGNPAVVDMKIMEDSLADASEIFNGKNGGNPVEQVDEATVLASAIMDDSLDFEFLNHVDGSNAMEFYVNGDSSGTAAQSGEDLALQKKLMDAATANEIFSDPSGMDFLANAGSKSGVHESELARQSLYQNFDPFMGKAASPVVQQQQQQQQTSTLMNSPAPVGAGVGARTAPAFRVPYPVQSHTATTDMIAAMQQKQNAMIRRQQSASTDRLPASNEDQQQPSSWPDLVTRRENPSSFPTMKNSPPPQPASVPAAPNSQLWQTPPSHTSQSQSSTSSQYYSPPLLNGSGDHQHGTNGDHLEDDYETLHDVNSSSGGSLVNFNLVDSTPRRPVTLRTKLANSASANKLYRRSVPAGFLDGREGLSNALGTALESHEEYSGFPELHPVWENVLATYEGLLRVTLNKLSALQTETCEARQKEAKAVKDQEEMHRVFVGLHERFETSKGVISTYRTNQETLQRAFDDLNAEFQPVLLENKKMQAAVRLNEMKMRQLEGDLEKKKDEIAELTKIVDDLISKDS